MCKAGAVKPYCLEAIATMRRFLDDAERALGYADATPERMISVVVEKTGWGFANMNGCLSSAISALEDVRKIAETRDANAEAK
jgi:hypothetical protein